MSKKIFCPNCNKKIKKTEIIRKWEKESAYTYARNLYCPKCNNFIKTNMGIDVQSYNLLFKEENKIVENKISEIEQQKKFYKQQGVKISKLWRSEAYKMLRYINFLLAKPKKN